MADDRHLRYPIGAFDADQPFDPGRVAAWIDAIAHFPPSLSAVCTGLDDADLERRYRPGGWTVRQVIHHIGDSHLNSYIRFKWALSETTPVIKAYDERRWAELPDIPVLPVATSLDFIEALHRKWTVLLRALDGGDLQRCFVHPESGETVPLWRNIGIYAWHGRHHLAHIQLALESDRERL